LKYLQQTKRKEKTMTDSVVPTYAGLSGQKLRFAITATATIGFLLFGYDQGVMSGIVSSEYLPLCFLGQSSRWLDGTPTDEGVLSLFSNLQPAAPLGQQPLTYSTRRLDHRRAIQLGISRH
jgi:hypothetical protein